ncbi:MULTISPECIES: F0F1 ATP synthase subunit epsilon [Shewanella]|uniref:ATP synthase epsilon chain n=2 Tax=Shewanella TaxID=22 RepID=A0ABQ2RCZ5_9GAMM|nr:MULTISPECIES: F0F1 ATP synthase subunit epsilon [Shewanella]MCL1151934.1 F0F1 ATP synthase subunit epsilon [Shewanella ulleungensis]GGP98056.1 ATP synthase epsilon chain [Shewanella ulleungensis]GGQ25635.1 ATP synthase epsilon chain [Shewanella litoralis]
MAAKTVQLDIVSAEDSIYHGEVSFFEVNGAEGELGIMPNHVALLTTIKPGMARFIKQDGSEEVLYLSGGLLEVQPTAISVLADVALRADDIDEKAALKAKERAEQAIANAGADFNYEAAAIELAKSLAQLKVVETIKRNITR